MAGLLVIAGTALAAERYEGMAYASGSDTLLYRETHWRYADQGVPTRLVLYRCPDGRAFARKRVREMPDAIAPDFDFRDARDGYREGVRSRNGIREVYWRPNATTPLRRRALPVRENAVIDAGFDAFIRSRWPGRTDATPLRVPFLLPSRQAFVNFKITWDADDHVAGRPVRRLRMALAAWYSFVLPDIELVYALESRRLLRFHGITTIRNDQGRHQQVRVEFPEAMTGDGDFAAEIDEAAKQTLVNRCTP